ncbi:thioesterase family protein [Mycolicibacterium sp. 018/SC-01/001]|uniref:acyl-CoA thioesterase n=1 Tax=Mycolicibacterium sp. 018/SC-01/001 TaxID=2592069 RepID=UPI00163DCC8D|nr:thioesterase family protein [Mycolicibacterium sp. 018/SC-01/001]
MPDRTPAATIDDYGYVLPITTRWMDNDVYGHVNNVTYYSYFDTVANHFLITEGGLDIHASEVIALVVESSCTYRAPAAYPDQLRAGLRVDALSRRAVTWGVAIFGADDTAALAEGRFVHVFVDRDDRRAVPIPEQIRTALESIATSP